MLELFISRSNICKKKTQKVHYSHSWTGPLLGPRMHLQTIGMDHLEPSTEHFYIAAADIFVTIVWRMDAKKRLSSFFR